MRLFSKLLLIIMTVSLVSCAGKEERQAASSASTKKESVRKKPGQGDKLSPYWTFIKDRVKLSEAEVKQLKKVMADHNARVKKLRAKGKWDGAKNAEVRRRFNVKKNGGIRKVIGKEKVGLWAEAQREWRRKNKK